ncbi:methyltransferase domain-containing protein [Akanthomyces lecanii RCEF 1005]|uniref:Methyltransferase domain-containing protein n=1 Tax=Akanthomyces lecanii RCEF 1005 TaxID=1081108 RepID=A0A162K728_CORDF|nr:methyltransferase domain-containing protein [Akanthomyces lecanii RCEF 1005]
MAVAAAREETFRKYSTEEAQRYAQYRQDYSQALYDAVLLFHASSGGKNGTLVDVGCGPGNVTRALGTHFQQAIGLDASPSMALQADEISRAAGATTRSGEPLSFYQSSAESLGADLDEGHAIRDGSVDLVTVANAAHWFDMPAFWRAARRVLRPRGTVAVWIPGEGLVHPSTPGAAALDAVLQRFITRDLLPHYLPGNFLFRDRYRSLPVPWTADPPVRGFDRGAFERREWDIAYDKPFVRGGDRPVGLDVIEAAASTMSPVTRWREANAELVGTERDVVKVLRRDMEAVLRENGVAEGEERVRMIMDGTLLLFKKSG